MRTLVVLDAPSNLGLRPPVPGAVPGCYKLAGALCERRIVQRLGALEGGVVVPPRYDRGEWQPGDGAFNAAAIARYTRTLADRIEGHVRAGEFAVVLGGDCSIQLGAALALRRLGRYGLAAVDGSADFRHVGNSDHVGAAGGEELAIATGRGQADLSDLEGLRPYLKDEDVRLFGMRDGDEDHGSGAPPSWPGPPWRAWRHPPWTATGSTSTPMSSTRASCPPSTARTTAA